MSNNVYIYLKREREAYGLYNFSEVCCIMILMLRDYSEI
jgi:hypothetical protein